MNEINSPNTTIPTARNLCCQGMFPSVRDKVLQAKLGYMNDYAVVNKDLNYCIKRNVQGYLQVYALNCEDKVLVGRGRICSKCHVTNDKI